MVRLTKEQFLALYVALRDIKVNAWYTMDVPDWYSIAYYEQGDHVIFLACKDNLDWMPRDEIWLEELKEALEKMG